MMKCGVLVWAGCALIGCTPLESYDAGTAMHDAGVVDAGGGVDAGGVDAGGVDAGGEDDAGCPGGLSTFYRDGDDDRFGDPTETIRACTAPMGYVEDDTDCNDGRDDIHPGSDATEIPGDGVDMDCIGGDRCTDFTCDGRPDLALMTGDGIEIYANTGGGFTASSSIAHATPSRIASADFDGDGYLDLAVVVYSPTRSANHRVYWGSASGFSTESNVALPDSGARDLAIGQLGGDDRPDLVIATYWPNNTSPTRELMGSIYISDGSARTFTEREVDSHASYSVAVADLNDDGRDDVVFGGWNTGPPTLTPTPVTNVYWGTSGGVSSGSTHATLSAEGGFLDVDAFDLDGDGYLDLIGATYNGDSRISLAEGTPMGAPSASDYSGSTTAPTSRPPSAAAHDFDDDGCAEIAFSAGTGTQSVLYVGVAAGGGCTWPEGDVRTFDTGATRQALIADLNRDGYAELIFAGATTWVFWGTADGPTDAGALEISSAGLRGVAVDDFEGDGMLDLVVAADETRVYWGRTGTPSLSADRFAPVSVAATGVLTGESFVGCGD